MNNTARLASQFSNVFTMHTFAILNEQMEKSMIAFDFDLQQQTYQAWEMMIEDVIKYVPAETV